ncbi:MAG: TraR/DksA C4-type zinc finger protein [Planctomycetes bacterium]|nr:TraR/DksA C4-type zinc finger protein [Planctomycetota bacterium]
MAKKNNPGKTAGKSGKPKQAARKIGLKPAPKAAVAQKKSAAGPAVKMSVKSAAKAFARAASKRDAAILEPPVGGLKKTLLSKSEIEEFRRLLLARRRSLIGDLDGLESGSLRTSRQEGSGDLSNMPTHPADIGTDNFEHEFSLGLLESERSLLSEINEALERVQNNTYGICLGTGKMIDKARLRARPWTKFCIEYARRMEKGAVRQLNPAENRPLEDDEEEHQEPVEEEMEE